MRDGFRAWLKSNYTANSAATHYSQARKVEEAYDNLDDIFDSGGVESVAAELNYSSHDAKLGKPNPSKISAGNNLYANLAAYKSSLRCEALGQITGYMGDLMSEEPGTPVRGILVAAEFDKSCMSGVRAIPALTLKWYRFSFTFESVA